MHNNTIIMVTRCGFDTTIHRVTDAKIKFHITYLITLDEYRRREK